MDARFGSVAVPRTWIAAAVFADILFSDAPEPLPAGSWAGTRSRTPTLVLGRGRLVGARCLEGNGSQQRRRRAVAGGGSGGDGGSPPRGRGLSRRRLASSRTLAALRCV